MTSHGDGAKCIVTNFFASVHGTTTTHGNLVATTNIGSG